MTTYVIGPENPLPPTNGKNDHALDLEEGDLVILNEGGEITASGFEASGIWGVHNVALVLNGYVRATGANSAGIMAHGSVNVGSSGTVYGALVGIGLIKRPTDDQANHVINAGVIEGQLAGISLSLSSAGRNIIDNSGQIIGGIASSGSAAGGEGDLLILNNTGEISKPGNVAIAGIFQNVIVNKGLIDGSIDLGHGDDFYDGRGGSVTGDIHLFEGNDTVYGGNGGERFSILGGGKTIDGGGGADTLLAPFASTIDFRKTGSQVIGEGGSWAILKNIENLVGGDADNDFFGGQDANALKGGGGDDTLSGAQGDDVLTGGVGLDLISGGSDTDVAVYSGNFSDYSIQNQSDGRVLMTDHRTGTNDGSDVLSEIEYLQFTDRTIALTKPNSGPASVSLDGYSVGDKASVGTVVGHLSGVDPDGDPLGYHLVTNPGAYFRIHGGKLLLDKALPHGAGTIEITIRASDPFGASVDKSFTITITSEHNPVAPQPPVTEKPLAEPPSLALKGGKRSDKLKGGEGDDRLDGGLGLDTLTGGKGADTFKFSTKLGPTNVDHIKDFRSGEDTLVLSRSIFKSLHKGELDHGAFRKGAKALQEDDRILYNAKTGALSFDKDGSGTEHAAVKFAVIKAGLSAADIWIA